ncbi:MAG: AAA family ATPase, partial [Nitrospirota bacterium]
LLVSGNPGIGKTALIQELARPVTEQKAYFIAGKYDQLKRDIPYSAVLQAFRSLIDQILSRSEQNNFWKKEILTAVGSNGRIIIDVIPEIERIIGNQPPVSYAEPLESQNRFNRVMQKFVGVFAQKDHPLVLFLDDLQWVDPASLNLIKILMTDPNSRYLLIIGAYRDTEVGSTHPFMHMVQDLTKAGVPITATMLPPLQIEHVNTLIADLIMDNEPVQENASHPLMLMIDDLTKAGVPITSTNLPPLAMEDVNTLVAGALQCKQEQSEPLAEIIYQKTMGNPFFIGQMLKVLYEEKLLVYDQGWHWNAQTIDQLHITDSIVELLISKIHKLSPSTQIVLKLAACIGNQFDLETLALVYEKPLGVTFTDLSPAIRESLIIPSNEEYLFYHDRIQEAAYSLIPEQEKKGTHYRIGSLILAKTRPDALPDKIFYVVDQLNAGADLATNEQERIRLADLNLTAGKKAKASTALASAAVYFKKGISLLSKQG